MTVLFKVKRNSYVQLEEERIRVPPEAIKPTTGEIFHFFHIDGMYSYCANNKGEVVHLPAWANVTVLDKKPENW